MPNTFELIASSTLGSSQTQIDFSSIPSTFTDLCLKLSLRTNKSSTVSDVYFQFNGSTGANYSMRRLYGTGSAAGSDEITNGATGGFIGYGVGATATASTFSNTEVYIPNYLSSTAKSWSADSVNENNATSANSEIVAGLWSLTNAINQITIKEYNGNSFVANSTAYLYGVKNA